MAMNLPYAEIAARDAERRARWKDLVKTDPHRVVRAMFVSSSLAESVEGDTMWDMQYILGYLKAESQAPKSDVWKGLVNAGVFNALCFLVTNAVGVAIFDDKLAGRSNQVEVDGIIKKQMYSAWFEPFQVICNAVMGCDEAVTATEQRMFEDLKRCWSVMMDRVWSDPVFCLDPDEKGMIERATLTQVVLRLILLDPCFLSIIFKPGDATMSVCCRNWLYATEREDADVNAAFLVNVLSDQEAPPHYKQYFASHPRLSMAELIARTTYGDSQEGGMKQNGRTPQLAADEIISAAARHLASPGMTLDELSRQLALLRAFYTPAKTYFPAIPRAAFKSRKLWISVVHVLRHAAQTDTTAAQELYLDALEACSRTWDPVAREDPAYSDALVAGWAIGGLFEAVEETGDFLMKIQGGTMLWALTLRTIKHAVPSLTTNTRALLRPHFPRLQLMNKLRPSFSGSLNDLDHTTFLAAVESSGDPDPGNPMWQQAAWELLEAIAIKIAAF